MDRKESLQNGANSTRMESVNFSESNFYTLLSQQAGSSCHLENVLPSLAEVGATPTHIIFGCVRGPSSRPGRRWAARRGQADAQGVGTGRRPRPASLSREDEAAEAGPQGLAEELEPKQKQPKVERGRGSRLGETVHGCPLEKRENSVPQSRAAGLLPSCGRGPPRRCPTAATAPFRRRRPLQARAPRRRRRRAPPPAAARPRPRPPARPQPGAPRTPARRPRSPPATLAPPGARRGPAVRPPRWGALAAGRHLSGPQEN